MTNDEHRADDGTLHDQFDPPALEEDASPQSEPETINDMPVWKLHGVTLTNRGLVLRSDAWIHLSDLGDEGWGLMAPEAQIKSWEQDLAWEGITVSPWEKMPYKPWGRTVLVTSGLLILAGFPLIVPFMIGTVLFVILGKSNQYACRNLRHAPGLRGLFEWTTLEGKNVSTSGYYDYPYQPRE